AVASQVPTNVALLFEARYSLEVEVRRIARSHEILRDRAPFNHILREMRSRDLIDESLEHILREIYFICSPAIHGDKVSEAQVAFVKDALPDMVAALRGIE